MLETKLTPHLLPSEESKVTSTTPSTINITQEESLLPEGLYRQDLDAMLYYSLHQEVGKMHVIANDDLIALKDFIRILAKVNTRYIVFHQYSLSALSRRARGALKNSCFSDNKCIEAK